MKKMHGHKEGKKEKREKRKIEKERENCKNGGAFGMQLRNWDPEVVLSFYCSFPVL